MACQSWLTGDMNKRAKKRKKEEKGEEKKKTAKHFKKELDLIFFRKEQLQFSMFVSFISDLFSEQLSFGLSDSHILYS